MNLTSIFFGIVFICAGIWFAFGKGLIHLSAWKTMPSEEKDKIKIKALCKNIGSMISACGGIFLIGGFIDFVFLPAMIAWLIVAGVDVYVINKSQMYILK